MIYRHLRQTGFTVVELLVATAVTSLMLILIMTFLVNTIATHTIDTARADLLREAQLTLDLLGKDIRLSANVDDNNRWQDPNSPNAASTNGFGWESGPNTLILAISAEDTSRNILFSDATHYITQKNNAIYYVSGGSLFKRTLAGDHADNRSVTSCPATVATPACPADSELVKNVSSFNVRYLNGQDQEVEPDQARLVEATLSLSATKYSRQIDAEYVTRMVFRNE